MSEEIPRSRFSDELSRWLDIGVVLLSLGVLLEDALIAAAGIAIGAAGISLIFWFGRAAVNGVTELALWIP